MSFTYSCEPRCPSDDCSGCFYRLCERPVHSDSVCTITISQLHFSMAGKHFLINRNSIRAKLPMFARSPGQEKRRGTCGMKRKCCRWKTYARSITYNKQLFLNVNEGWNHRITTMLISKIHSKTANFRRDDV